MEIGFKTEIGFRNDMPFELSLVSTLVDRSIEPAFGSTTLSLSDTKKVFGLVNEWELLSENTKNNK